MKTIQMVRVVTEPEEEAVREVVRQMVVSLQDMGVKVWVEIETIE